MSKDIKQTLLEKVKGREGTPRVRQYFCEYCDEVLLTDEKCTCPMETVRTETLEDIKQIINEVL